MSEAFLIAVLPVKPWPEMQLNSVSCLAGDKVLGQEFFSRGKTTRNESARKRAACYVFSSIFSILILPCLQNTNIWPEFLRSVEKSQFLPFAGAAFTTFIITADIHTFLFALRYTKTYNLQVKKEKKQLLESSFFLKYLIFSFPPQIF